MGADGRGGSEPASTAITVGASDKCAPAGSPVAFLHEELAAGVTVTRTGYTITMEGTPVAGSPAGCTGAVMGDGAPAYRAGADSLRPVDARFFATNAEGIIYEDQVSIYAGMPEWGPSPVGHVIQ